MSPEGLEPFELTAAQRRDARRSNAKEAEVRPCWCFVVRDDLCVFSHTRVCVECLFDAV